MFSATGKNLRSSLILILASATLLFCAAPATFAKAYFGTRLEMERWATDIALVKIEKCEPCKMKSANWTYGTRSEAKVLKTLKGKLPETITIYGQEDFPCAQCNFPVGTHLVFLKKDGNNYFGANWDYSCLKVSGANTQWMPSPSAREFTETSLDKAIIEIKTDLEAIPQLDKLSTPAQILLCCKSFNSKMVGMNSTPCAEYQACEKLKAEKASAKAELLLISKYGTAPGKLYAGILLTHINAKEGRALLRSYLNSEEQLPSLNGCIGSRDSLGKASKKALESGSYNGIELGK